MIFLSIVGFVWLGVGIFVLFKQGGRSPFVLHFATVCLAAFVFHIYKPIGFGADFDLGVSLMDDLAFAFFVPLFVHFCIRYPVRSSVFDGPKWRTYALYAPAAVLSLGLMIVTLVPLLFIRTSAAEAIVRLDDRFNLIGSAYTALFYQFVIGVSIGGCFLVWRFLKNHQPIVRQRLKWAMWGTIAAVFPIVVFKLLERFGVYIPDDNYSAAITTLPLALIPLSFGHSVVRYRLMDVDVVVRRALVYAMTTVAIAMMIGAVAGVD
jgi:hypothetical protein